MTRLCSPALALAFGSLLFAGSAFAQAPTPAAPTAPAAKTAPAAPAAKTTAPKSATAKPARTAASLDCSKQADAKGLHGKERKKFRSECKQGGAKH